MNTSPESFQGLFDTLALKKPSVGKIVTVTAGAKKHVGKTGRVTWHGQDRFAPPRYVSKWSIGETGAGVALGTYGYRVRVQPEDGEAFFVSAAHVQIQ